jgi:hypothetical protein
VKYYFEDPTIMWEAYADETDALKAGLTTIWSDLVKKANKDAASQNISSTWRLHGH